MKKWCLFLSLYMLVCCLAACGAVEKEPVPPPAASAEAPEEPVSEKLALYRQVLEDLWTTDSGLNEDVSIIGVDLSSTSLTGQEQSALAEEFAAAHGIELVEGTWQELCDAGYIDVENLYWAEGCHFSITEREGSALAFDAQKWRSGLGAYFFSDCTAAQSESGEWTYTVGVHAIS